MTPVTTIAEPVQAACDDGSNAYRILALTAVNMAPSLIASHCERMCRTGATWKPPICLDAAHALLVRVSP